MRFTRAQIVHSLGAIVALGLFVLAVGLLHHQLRAYGYQDIRRELANIPLRQITPALLLTIGSYVILTFYDVLALRYIGRPLDYGRTALASFVAYVFSHNVGLGVIGGTAARFRMYSTWQYSAVDVARIVTFTGATFWLGLLGVGGVVFMLRPPAVPPVLRMPQSALPILGSVLLAMLVVYLAWTSVRRTPIKVAGWEFARPTFGMALMQTGLSAVDWVIASTVLYVLLPAGAPAFPEFIGIFTLGQVAGFISHVPGGLGVFESVILASMGDGAAVPSVVGALVVYRGIYYLLPFAIGTALLGGHELLRRRDRVRRAAQVVEIWAPRIVPHALALTSVLAGSLLLVTGALPGPPHRLTWFHRIVPLPVMELSHFLASVAGMGLLVLGRGLQRRLDAAYRLTLVLLATGILVTMLRAFDFAEAITLSLMLLLLLPCRRHFHRKAALFSERFTPGWIALVAMVLLGSTWLGFFAHKHVEYSSELWWRFSLDRSGDVPRALRALVGAAAIAVLVGLWRLLRAGGPEPHVPDATEMQTVREVVARSRASNAHLALVGDKSVLFNDARDAFIMYGVEGRSWIAMGDPVGPPEEAAELAWRYRGLCDVHDGWTVFHAVGNTYTNLYIDLGLTLLKIGEAARVDLSSFSLEGGARKALRQAVHRVERSDCRVEIVGPEGVGVLLPELRRISDGWLAEKSVREKGFSLGYFDEEYLKAQPVAIVRRGGRIEAFANLWMAAGKEELSVDLMRYTADAPAGVMEYLFASLMRWGRENGYRWFNLGMAPLAGLENRALSPLWTRVGSLLFAHGEHFYNFQGVRQYKDKFDPVWAPRYLASPGGFALPRILTNLAALISGGLRGVVMR